VKIEAGLLTGKTNVHFAVSAFFVRSFWHIIKVLCEECRKLHELGDKILHIANLVIEYKVAVKINHKKNYKTR